MEKMKGAIGSTNYACNGKQPLLPPISPIPTISSAYANFCSSAALGFDGFSTQRDQFGRHQRTSSESILIEEQPSWLDDLLNEPEMPITKGAHRRSSSDSFAYANARNISFNFESGAPADYKYKASVDYNPDQFQDLQHTCHETERPKNKGWENLSKVGTHPSSISKKDQISHKSAGSSGYMSEPDGMTSNGTKKQDQHISVPQNSKGSSERIEGTQSKQSQSQPEMDRKRIKQQFAQRSRVRKLQYIAELEKTVQALQAEGSEVSAELQFLDQQNIILSLENKTLRQRLDSLAQEHLIKQFQQEMLEREIARLRSFFVRQQQQQQPAYAHWRSGSRDLESQLVNLSIKQKEANSPRDSVTAPVHMKSVQL